MAYQQGDFAVLSRRELAPGVFDYLLRAPTIAAVAKAGQFVQVRADGFFLRRPISICEIDQVKQTLRLVFEIRGDGTRALAAVPERDQLGLIGPLGNGFTLLEPSRKAVLVGGGIGVPPMLEVARHYGGNATAIIGFRNASAVILQEDFAAAKADTRLATDDGSAGHHGFVTDLLEQRLREGQADIVCACGPMAMLKGVAALAERYGVPCEVSLEAHMACGVGACLVCACRTVRNGKEIYSHVCKDGPVFDAKVVAFE